MSYIGPTSLDLLTTSGVLDVDAQAFITGTPSEYLRQSGINSPITISPDNNLSPKLPSQPIVDQYNPQKLLGADESLVSVPAWKKAGALALGAYLLGVVLSKGKVNPRHWKIPTGNILKNVVTKFSNIFKHITKKP